MRRIGIGLVMGAALSALLTLGAASAGAACTNEAIRTQQGSGFLPDCRAYEMVSPPHKGGGNVFRFQAQASPVGDELLFSSPASFSSPESALRINNLIGRRQGDGWASSSTNPPLTNRLVPFNATLRGASKDLGAQVMMTNAALTPDVTDELAMKLFRRDAATGGYDLLTPVSPTGFEAVFYEPQFLAGSTDFDHIAYQVSVQQTPDAPIGVMNLYEWSDGAVRVVNVLPDDECAELSLPAGCVAPGGGAAADPNAFGAELRNIVSADGSRIFFSAGDNIYLREDGTTSTQIGPDVSRFMEATPSGDKVLYTVPGTGELAQFDVESGNSTQLAAAAEGVIGQSDDGEYVYFVSTSQLDPDAPVGIKPKIYLWHAGDVTFVSELAATSETGDNLNYSYLGTSTTTRAVTPDGRHMVFHSALPHPGYNNSNPDCNGGSSDPEALGFCIEIYRYSADADELVCVSCTPDESMPTGSASTEDIETGITTNWENLPSFLPDSGSRVFFISPDPLVAEDTNGARDVYLWEEGAGARLISTGRSDQSSTFLGADASGDSAYFWTFERLVGIDRDANGDAYVAKVGGGFSAQSPPPPPPPCLGEGCKGAAVAAPGAVTPITSSVRGAGNAKPKRKHHKKKQNKKKQSKKGKQKQKQSKKNNQGAR